MQMFKKARQLSKKLVKFLLIQVALAKIHQDL